MPSLNHYLEKSERLKSNATRKIFLAFLGGILKIKYLRLAKNTFPKIFQLIFLVSQKR